MDKKEDQGTATSHAGQDSEQEGAALRATNCGHDLSDWETEARQSPRPPSWWAALKAVFWGFLGVRRNKDYAKDMVQLGFKHFVVAGLLGGILFVAVLVALVAFITR